MCDKMSAPNLSESFRREMELLNAMVTTDEITTQLNNLGLTEKELNPVVYGPLSEAYYVVNCPFVWSEYISNENIESFIDDMEEKFKFRDGDWKAFCAHLYLGFLYARLGKLSDAFKQMQICEEQLSKNSDSEYYKEILDGLNHGIQATKAHLHFLKGETEIADEIISNVVPVKELNNPSKAALIALNVEVMDEFSLPFKETALKMIELAIKLDPDDDGFRRGTWYYKAGKLHGQLRRLEHRAGMPSRMELQMLERATKKNPLPVSLATLADSYREASASAAFNSKVKVSREVCFKMLSQAKELYERAIELNDDNPSTLRRCGNGLMKLPIPHRDLPLAKQCLLKTINLNPKASSAYQALGTMEEKYFKNLKEALHYFQLSYDNGNPISGLFILQVNMKMDRNYNPIDDLNKFIEDQKESRSDLKAEYLMVKGEYLFFQRKDLLAAAKIWMESITLNPKSENVMNHVCRFLYGKRIEKPYITNVAGRYVFNVYKCLDYEIRSVIETQRYSDEDKAFLIDLLKLCGNNSEK